MKGRTMTVEQYEEHKTVVRRMRAQTLVNMLRNQADRADWLADVQFASENFENVISLISDAAVLRGIANRVERDELGG